MADVDVYFDDDDDHGYGHENYDETPGTEFIVSILILSLLLLFQI